MRANISAYYVNKEISRFSNWRKYYFLSSKPWFILMGAIKSKAHYKDKTIREETNPYGAIKNS